MGAPREDRPPGYHLSPGALDHGSGLFTCPWSCTIPAIPSRGWRLGAAPGSDLVSPRGQKTPGAL